MNVNEFNIIVPWGHIAVKTWGNQQNTPILALHGLADNAGTFDRLLPLLPTSFYYICVDLPGHGKSSPYPPYLLISAMTNILTFKLIIEYFNRERYILMAHGWNGQIAVFFAQMYPEHVLKLVILDVFYLPSCSVEQFREELRTSLDMLINIVKKVAKNKPPSYTYEEAVTRLMNGRLFSVLNREAAESLIKRSLIALKDGNFRFSTDPRLKIRLNLLFGSSYAVDLLKKYPITCPMLFVISSESEFQLHYYEKVIEEFRKNKHCIIEAVVGDHDVHNNSPEIVSASIRTFLFNDKSKL